MKQIMAMALLGALGLTLAACIIEEPGRGGYHGGYERHEGSHGYGDRDEHHWR